MIARLKTAPTFLIHDLHILAGDVRGHGGSNQPNIERVRHWNIFADDLKTLVEQAMSPPVIGMGHSLGAVTTYIAAATASLADRIKINNDRGTG